MNDVSSKSSNSLTLSVGQVDEQLAHLWMVRTFIKHSDESQDDEDLREIARELYDFILALAPAKNTEDDEAYVKMARKKFPKVKKAAELFDEIYADVSSHTNFEMANKSLQLVIQRIDQILQGLGQRG